MTIWLLDDGPVGILARCFNQDWAWPAATLHVVEEVARAADQDRTGRRQKLFELRSAGDTSIRVHVVGAESTAGLLLFGHLRPDGTNSSKNLGEHASIALAATELTHAVFVTMDKGAAYLALAELGPGRVCAPFDCWEDLRNRDLINAEEFEELCTHVWKGDGHLSGLPYRFRNAP